MYTVKFVHQELGPLGECNIDVGDHQPFKLIQDSLRVLGIDVKPPEDHMLEQFNEIQVGQHINNIAWSAVQAWEVPLDYKLNTEEVYVMDFPRFQAAFKEAEIFDNPGSVWQDDDISELDSPSSIISPDDTLIIEAPLQAVSDQGCYYEQIAEFILRLVKDKGFTKQVMRVGECVTVGEGGKWRLMVPKEEKPDRLEQIKKVWLEYGAIIADLVANADAILCNQTTIKYNFYGWGSKTTKEEFNKGYTDFLGYSCAAMPISFTLWLIKVKGLLTAQYDEMTALQLANQQKTLFGAAKWAAMTAVNAPAMFGYSNKMGWDEQIKIYDTYTLPLPATTQLIKFAGLGCGIIANVYSIGIELYNGFNTLNTKKRFEALQELVAREQSLQTQLRKNAPLVWYAFDTVVPRLKEKLSAHRIGLGNAVLDTTGTSIMVSVACGAGGTALASVGWGLVAMGFAAGAFGTIWQCGIDRIRKMERKYPKLRLKRIIEECNKKHQGHSLEVDDIIVFKPEMGDDRAVIALNAALEVHTAMLATRLDALTQKPENNPKQQVIVALMRILLDPKMNEEDMDDLALVDRYFRCGGMEWMVALFTAG